ncbi:lithostathine-like [Neolamprologus brichardi]|uniref:lithostathine-like n=1 Tax=Neolamprologus brichardi TaxID=32507 RepID=UPI001643DB14|nr:lithostathine-like [Neolamprologus brichardi]
MDYTAIIFVLIGALVNGTLSQTHQYYYVSTSLNWTEAQSHCRHAYTDLATIESTILCTINGQESFVKVNLPMNWTDAQSFCRNNYVDLPSIRNQTENDKIKVTANGSFVWIGLYRQKVWSDGSYSLFQFWATGQPNSGHEQCVAADFSDSGRWSDELCSNRFSSVCFTTITFSLAAQTETSITLQWNKVNNNVSFVLQFNGTETNISAPAGNGPMSPEMTVSKSFK